MEACGGGSKGAGPAGSHAFGRADGGSGSAARRVAWPRHQLFAQGLHPADEAVPRRLPLLHLRGEPAPRPRAPICRPRRCWRSPAPAPPPAAPRRCSPWATSRSCAGAGAGGAGARWGIETTIAYLEPPCARWCWGDRAAAACQPRRDEPRRDRRACAPSPPARASCWRSRAPGCASAAGPHHGRPDKHPAARLEVLRLAGELRVPFTTGILIGIGETRAERIEALLAIARSARATRPYPGSHHPELPRQARHQAGRGGGAGGSTTCSGPSPRRGWCWAGRCTSRRRRTCRPASTSGWSRRAWTTGAASRR